jgi:CheY-like chemotaxis protein
MGLKVLFLHVNTDDRQMYAEYLASQGCEVTEIANTDAALALLADTDIVVTGLQIPGSLHPVDLIAAIRREPRTASMPVIVVTACGFSDWLRRAREEGADAVLLKPCLPSILLAEMRKAVAARAGEVRTVVKADRRQLKDRRGQRRGGRRAADDLALAQLAKMPSPSPLSTRRRRTR